MSPGSEYKCCECGERHPRQAFISHAAKDAEIAKEAAKACCAAQVTPYLFEYSAEFSQPAIDNARTIADEINSSDIFLVVLSPSVSEAFWTQAWIGFEIGVSIGADIATHDLERRNYLSSRIIVLQDIYQEINVSVPRIVVLSLFDFSRTWDDTQDLLKFMSAYISEPSGKVFQLGNRLRQRMMTGRATCENETCKGDYDVVMPTKDTGLLEFKVWCNDLRLQRLRWIEKGFQAECTLKCPSCVSKTSINVHLTDQGKCHLSNLPR